MVCIAAFIILLAIWLFTPILRLFGKKKLANNISKLFKKSIHCFSRRVTFRACDSNFKDEIKESLTSRLIVRHKKLVKPVSIGIEISSLLIILITIWSALTLVKSGLALYVYGTCNVRQPASCALSTTKACSIDNFEKENPIKEWFSDWGDIFSALPSRMKSWDETKYIPKGAIFMGENLGNNGPSKVALDIIDPGCIICRESFVKQSETHFFKNYKTYIIPYVISGPTGDKFNNSRLIASYIEASREFDFSNKYKVMPEEIIIKNLFTSKNDKGIPYQELLNGTKTTVYTTLQAKLLIKDWFKKAGISDEDITNIENKSTSDEVKERLLINKKLVEDTIKTKKIPTIIYDNKKHEGLFK